MFFLTRNVLAILSGVCDIRKLPVILSFVFCITRSILVSTFCFLFQVNFIHRECVFCITKMCNFINCILCHKICVCYVEMFCFPKNMLSCLLLFQVYFVTQICLLFYQVYFVLQGFIVGFIPLLKKASSNGHDLSYCILHPFCIVKLFHYKEDNQKLKYDKIKGCKCGYN